MTGQHIYHMISLFDTFASVLKNDFYYFFDALC